MAISKIFSANISAKNQQLKLFNVKALLDSIAEDSKIPLESAVEMVKNPINESIFKKLSKDKTGKIKNSPKLSSWRALCTKVIAPLKSSGFISREDIDTLHCLPFCALIDMADTNPQKSYGVNIYDETGQILYCSIFLIDPTAGMQDIGESNPAPTASAYFFKPDGKTLASKVYGKWTTDVRPKIQQFNATGVVIDIKSEVGEEAVKNAKKKHSVVPLSPLVIDDVVSTLTITDVLNYIDNLLDKA